MQFDWWTFTFQAVNLLVLMWLLGRFLFRPIAGIIARREAETRQTLEAAAESQRQATAAQTAADGEPRGQAVLDAPAGFWHRLDGDHALRAARGGRPAQRHP